MRELSVPSPLRCDVSVSSLNTYTTGADIPTRTPIYLFIYFRPSCGGCYSGRLFGSPPPSSAVVCTAFTCIILFIFLVLPLSCRWRSYAQFADRALLFQCFGSSSLESLLCPFVPSKPACARFLFSSASLPFLSPYVSFFCSAVDALASSLFSLRFCCLAR